MRPAEGELRGIVRLAGDQAAKPGITIHLEQAAEPAQMRLRMFALAILAVDIGSGRMSWPTPGPIVDGVAPEPSGLGAASPGIENNKGEPVSDCLAGAVEARPRRMTDPRQ